VTLRLAAARLAAAGSETPRLDAELLLGKVTGLDRAELVLAAGQQLDDPVFESFAALVARREAREPVAYILGTRGFRWIELEVDPRALIPRPETELLVEAGLELAQGASVIDVGTGSGAVALALAAERPDLRVTGSDVSVAALELARENAMRLRLAGRVEFVAADLLPEGRAAPDAVLANLPYVPDGEELPPEVGEYEPPGALFAGPDGLDVIRRLAGGLPAAVRFVALEHGAGQADTVAVLLAAAGFARVERRRDLAGIERVAVAWR
jgi:release factor glutamine methyltransferase